jgi:tetratricopeptide (TPR) repeat protein
MTKAQQHLQAGIEAQKRKDYERAEEYLLAAFNQYPAGDGGRRTAAISLGAVYRQAGRYEDAIAALEAGLPFPGAFKELVSVYRFLAKAAKKDGDTAGAAARFGRMFSLAKMHATVMTLRAAGMPNGVDWDRSALWIEDIRRQCGTIYAFPSEGIDIAGDGLLSAADYNALRAATGRG